VEVVVEGNDDDDDDEISYPARLVTMMEPAIRIKNILTKAIISLVCAMVDLLLDCWLRAFLDNCTIL